MKQRANVLTIAAALAAVAGAAASAAHAQDLPGIQMPSHNIYCMASPAMDGQPTELRCDIQQMTNRRPAPPSDCPEDYGDSYFINPTGWAQLTCHGDTVANPDYPVLFYGQTWNVYGFSCFSATSGITCRNREGHGFSLSREAQSTF
jgi:hypothetical protein